MNTTTSMDQMVKRVRRQTLGDLLKRTSARMPNKLAIVYEDERLTYEQLAKLVNQTAHTFTSRGMKKGDRVALLSKNSLDFVVVQFALANIGAIMVPINYMLTASDIRYILNHAKIETLVGSTEYAPLLEESSMEMTMANRYLIDTDSQREGWGTLRDQRTSQPDTDSEVELDDDDLAQVLYTSGTESRPKGVMLTHKSLISEYVSTIIDGKMETRDVMIHALPLYHCAQLHVFLGPSVYLGCTNIILSAPKPEAMFDAIEKDGATQLFCPPTVWIALLRHPSFDERDLSNLEKCYYGAAIMPREVLKELSTRLPNARFWNFYGQTEIAPLATALQPEDQLRKLGSAGVASLNVETRIVDDHNQEVPRGQMGEIVHRTPHAMKGYLDDPKKTAETFRGGWFHSGDLGVMDEEGYVTIVDRKKDMINTGGVNVSSREVEETLYELDGVSEVAVIGTPDPYWIEAVTALVVTKAGSELQEETVLKFCEERLSKFKIPKQIKIVPSLPKNPSGKILKRSLREEYSQS
ncbi:acyl-CoA synthetase [Geomicrobium sediminis]|uniref:Fatty-acyl-CoA synthase n=1 Tax=Geomicrobium sediminis TaxID=1347788 RepID=A0ABS2PC18_9BACL|nr:acyl-CoA synthetase [Geomicrobium sediminis]MBM7632977.1 fatty-acyl-CoA synthase [Geomicrobium sediminis]